MREAILKVVVVLSALVMMHAHAVAQWDYIGLQGHTAYELRPYQGRLYAATNNGVFYHDLPTLDTVWTPVGLQGRIINTVLPVTHDTILAGVRISATSDTTSLYRTTDGGASWHPFQNGFGGDTEFKEVVSLERLSLHSDLIFATGINVIARSSDRGLNWEVSYGSWDSFGQGTQFLEVEPSYVNSIWSGGEAGSLTPLLLRSIDSGDTWQEIRPYLGGENACYAVAVDPTNPEVVYAGTEGSIIKSVDGGQNWQTVLTPAEYPYYFGLEVSPTDPTVIYAAGASNSSEPQPLTLYISENGGMEWRTSVYDSLTHGGVGDLLLERTFPVDVVYIATRTRDTTASEGVFTFRNPLTSYSGGENGIPAGYSLAQNYPNPFNPSTSIEFALPLAGFVSLEVYNVLGEEMATLVSGDHAAGTFKATWDATGLPSGVYLYRLTAGEYAQTRKMVLMK